MIAKGRCMLTQFLAIFIKYNFKAYAHHNAMTQGNAHRRDSTMAALLLGIVVVFMVCHSVKISLNVYEAYQVNFLNSSPSL